MNNSVEIDIHRVPDDGDEWLSQPEEGWKSLPADLLDLRVLLELLLRSLDVVIGLLRFLLQLLFLDHVGELEGFSAEVDIVSLSFKEFG